MSPYEVRETDLVVDDNNEVRDRGELSPYGVRSWSQMSPYEVRETDLVIDDMG